MSEGPCGLAYRVLGVAPLTCTSRIFGPIRVVGISLGVYSTMTITCEVTSVNVGPIKG